MTSIYWSAGESTICSHAPLVCFSRTSSNAAAIRSITSVQFPSSRWRNSRIVGYQGESSRSSSHRQSLARGSAAKVDTGSRSGTCHLCMHLSAYCHGHARGKQRDRGFYAAYWI
jgi:hypothetical protein